jgi:hypothetical protein
MIRGGLRGVKEWGWEGYLRNPNKVNHESSRVSRFFLINCSISCIRSAYGAQSSDRLAAYCLGAAAFCLTQKIKAAIALPRNTIEATNKSAEPPAALMRTPPSANSPTMSATTIPTTATSEREEFDKLKTRPAACHCALTLASSFSQLRLG